MPMDDLISRKAAIEETRKIADYESKNCTDWAAGLKYAEKIILPRIPSVPAVPLDKLCELLAEMYHCPSSGWPSSGRACHPGCPDEVFEKLCGTDCESYSDVERWRAFLTKWMEGLHVS